ncbi:MAG TPA: MarR family transcriptional regulator [Mycobacteriales bacterium]|nr:MarR family transcriptional regulator [Mycobacteriales bacterium]
MTSAPASHAEVAARLRVAIARLARQLRQQSVGGLSPSQWSAMITIEDNEPVRIGDVAEREGVSAPTATRIVAVLEEAGMVSRSSDPLDRRTAYIALTETGREKLEWSRSVRTAALVQRLGHMSEEDIGRLVAALPVLESLLVDERLDHPPAD